MVYRVAVCDDDQKQIQEVESILRKWSRQSGHTCHIRAFPSGEAFLFDYEEDRAYDILLLDVKMKGLSGIDLARRVRKDNSRAEIIFLTSYFEFAGEGYDVDALHYLLKPVCGDKLEQVLDKAAEKLSRQPPHVVIFCEGSTIKLYETEILYVESFLHYISIHTANGEYKIKENISSFGEKLSGAFFRVHRSYLVPLCRIIRISRTYVTLEGDIKLPLARGKYDEINRAYIRNC